MVVDFIFRHPFRFLDKLESVGRIIEAGPNQDGDGEGAQRRPERAPTGIICNFLRRAAHEQQDQQRADHRQEGYNTENGHIAGHRYEASPPTAMYQVTSATTPIIMAKA